MPPSPLPRQSLSWNVLDLAALEERPPVTPTIGGLIYPGRRHVFSGPPESAKTWAALALAVEEIRNGGTVLHVDFEMFSYETRDRLRCLGVTDEEFQRFLHVEPEIPATETTIGELLEYVTAPTLAIIDAAAGAYSLQGLGDNDRRDVELFARTLIEPFRQREIATVVLDHVVKNAESRGAWMIGSERKAGAADVHLGFEPVTPFGRGRNGLIRIVTHKDRFGYLSRPRAAELELRSDPDTYQITWEFKPPAVPTEHSPEGPGNGWRPTWIMGEIVRHLNEHPEPATRNAIAKEVRARRQYVLEAIDCLVHDGTLRDAGGKRLELVPVPGTFPEPPSTHGNQPVPGGSHSLDGNTSGTTFGNHFANGNHQHAQQEIRA
jgi:hypothetical protein